MAHAIKKKPIAMKAGGSSMAEAKRVARVCAIVQNNPVVVLVVSAPGTRRSRDRKLTDLLFDWYERAQSGRATLRLNQVFKRRFYEIGDTLVPVERKEAWYRLKREIARLDAVFRKDSTTKDFAVSRGEYYMAKVTALILGWRFVDAAELVKFDDHGECQWDYSYSLMHNRLVGNDGQVIPTVIPGFYGSKSSSLDDSDITLFGRGESDTSGSIASAGLHSLGVVCWNGTDKPGILTADPALVKEPRVVPYMDYSEANEACYFGARVLHPKALHPLARFGIHCRIFSTFEPEKPGTWITPKKERPKANGDITCITGRGNFALMHMKRSLLNEDVGAMAKVLTVIADHGIPIEGTPYGVNRFTVVFDLEKVSMQALEELVPKVKASIEADHVKLVQEPMAQLMVVGRNMHERIGTAAKTFAALRDVGINLVTISQDYSELSIMAGIKETDLPAAVRALHKALVEPSDYSSYPAYPFADYLP